MRGLLAATATTYGLLLSVSPEAMLLYLPRAAAAMLLRCFRRLFEFERSSRSPSPPYLRLRLLSTTTSFSSPYHYAVTIDI